MVFSNGSLAVTGPTATAGMFATYPNEHLSFMGSIIDQVSILPGSVAVWLSVECFKKKSKNSAINFMGQGALRDSLCSLLSFSTTFLID
jgi:hypothetical protein